MIIMTRIFGRSFEDIVKQGCHISQLYTHSISNYWRRSTAAQGTHQMALIDEGAHAMNMRK